MKIKTFIKEIFYRKELEIFRVGMTNEYGLRYVWRSRFKTPDGISGWRNYSTREGDTIVVSLEEMRKIIKQAESFVIDMRKKSNDGSSK